MTNHLIESDSVATVLKQSVLLGGSSSGFIDEVARHCRAVEFDNDQVLLEAGTMSTSLFVIGRGTVSLDFPIDETASVVLGLRGPGETIGLTGLGIEEGHLVSAVWRSSGMAVELPLEVLTPVGFEHSRDALAATGNIIAELVGMMRGLATTVSGKSVGSENEMLCPVIRGPIANWRLGAESVLVRCRGADQCLTKVAFGCPFGPIAPLKWKAWRRRIVSRRRLNRRASMEVRPRSIA